jgi:predicted metal-dependent hydrolase
VSPGLRAALREYNAGRFFECHEALEELLDETAEEDWSFTVGLIQVAVGYHKLTSAHPGGEKLLAMGLEKLAPYADDHAGLDVARLRAGIAADLGRIAEARRAGRAATPVPPQLLPVRRAERSS